LTVSKELASVLLKELRKLKNCQIKTAFSVDSYEGTNSSRVWGETDEVITLPHREMIPRIPNTLRKHQEAKQ